MTMGEKILSMRKARGWSQEELADQWACSVRQYPGGNLVQQSRTRTGSSRSAICMVFRLIIFSGMITGEN